MKIYLQFILIILFSNISIVSFCQSYYSNTYSNPWRIESNWELHKKNDNNLIQLNTRSIIDSVSIGLNQINIREIDPINGSLLWEDAIANDSLYLNAIGKHVYDIIGDSILYVISSAQQIIIPGDSILSMPMFIKYDLQKQKLLKMIPHAADLPTYINSLVLHQGYFYASGYLHPYWGYKDKDVFLIKMDVEGNVIWQKVMDLGQNEQFFEIESFQNDLLVTGFHTNDYWTKPYMMLIDTAGNELKKTDIEYFGTSGTLEIEVHDEHVYFLTTVNREVETFHTQYLAKYDMDFALQWDTLITNTSLYKIVCRRIEVLNDELIIISSIDGARDFTGRNNWGHAASWSLDGEFNWEHAYYYDIDWRQQLDDVEAMPNGDLIFMGTVTDNDSEEDSNIFADQYLWLFRTDSQGCGTVQDTCYYTLDEYFGLDTIVNIFNFPTLENHSLQILGNPFAAQLVLKSNHKPLNISIYDMQGQLVYEGWLNGTLQLKTENWPNGVYVLQAMDDGQLLGVEKLLKQ